MKNHECRTYLSIDYEVDPEKNAELLRKGGNCTPEELGIFTSDELSAVLSRSFGVVPQWDRHRFEIGICYSYDVDVNVMIRKTLCGILEKGKRLREICEYFGVTATLEVVPTIACGSEEPSQCLSLDKDIIAFLYESGAGFDLDYYVV